MLRSRWLILWGAALLLSLPATTAAGKRKRKRARGTESSVRIHAESYPKLRPGRNRTEVYADVLPPDLLARVRAFVIAFRAAHPESGTRFLPLVSTTLATPSHADGGGGGGGGGDSPAPPPPRHAVEEAMRFLAAHVVRPDVAWEGCDWWVQIRPVDAPKEFHTDTDTARLERKQERWHPQLSSVSARATPPHRLRPRPPRRPDGPRRAAPLRDATRSTTRHGMDETRARAVCGSGRSSTSRRPAVRPRSSTRRSASTA